MDEVVVGTKNADEIISRSGTKHENVKNPNHHATRRGATRHDATWRDTARYDAIRRDTTRYDATQRD